MSEDLRAKYAEVLEPLRGLDISDEALWLEEGMLTLCLRHIERCCRCGARLTKPAPQGSLRKTLVEDCALGNGGWYLAVSREATAGHEDPETGKWVRPQNPNPALSRFWPQFRMFPCPGPAERKAQIAAVRQALLAREARREVILSGERSA